MRRYEEFFSLSSLILDIDDLIHHNPIQISQTIGMCTRDQEFKGGGYMSIYHYDNENVNLIKRHDLDEYTLMKNADIPTTCLNRIKVISFDKTEEL